LARHFLRLHATRLGRPELEIGPEAQALLLAYDWPGNVRELNNEMERAAALAAGPALTPQDLSDKLTRRLQPAGGPAPADEGASGSRSRRSDDEALAALARHGGNKTRAAKELGLTREGLRRKLMRLVQS
jgi:two-component system response regulator HupR/HoxA